MVAIVCALHRVQRSAKVVTRGRRLPTLVVQGNAAMLDRDRHHRPFKMQQLLPFAATIGTILLRRRERIAIAESAAGGLINAALLAVPGASRWCLGGVVLYTRQARLALKHVELEQFEGLTGATEPYVQFLARTVRARFTADWCLCESGAAGPTGNRYGHAAGHACFAVSGAVERTTTLETGETDRLSNMHAFAAAGLTLLAEALAAADEQ